MTVFEGIVSWTNHEDDTEWVSSFWTTPEGARSWAEQTAQNLDESECRDVSVEVRDIAVNEG